MLPVFQRPLPVSPQPPLCKKLALPHRSFNHADRVLSVIACFLIVGEGGPLVPTLLAKAGDDVRK